MAAIEYTLRHCTQRSKEAYSFYIDNIQQRKAEDIAINKHNLKLAKQDHKNYINRYNEAKSLRLSDPDTYNKHYGGSLEHFNELVSSTSKDIKRINTKISNLKEKLPSEVEFYELVDSYLLKLLSTDSIIEQDIICDELVDYIKVSNGFVSEIKLNPPYNLMVDLDELSLGGGWEIRTPAPGFPRLTI